MIINKTKTRNNCKNYIIFITKTKEGVIMTILIVEDEEKLREELKIFLESNGYQVETVKEFQNLDTNIFKINCDLILLDINLPFINGEYLLKEIRKKSNLPIIMITSKNTELDELLSISLGADDFITKPFNPQILLARINRLLTRKNNQNETIKYKNALIDVSKSLIETEDSKENLTRNELKILTYLLENKGTIVSRDDLINYLWDSDEYIDDNTLTVNINRLRTKLASLGLKDVIITKRSQGYIIL